MTDCVKAAINLSVNAVIYKDCRKQVFVAGTERRHSSGLNFAHRFFFCSSLKMSFGSPIKNRNGREHVECMQMRSPSQTADGYEERKGAKHVGLAAFHGLVGAVAAVVIVVADKSPGDAGFVVAAEGAVVARVVGC